MYDCNIEYRCMLDSFFFNRNPIVVAKQLLGKVIYAKYQSGWLCAKVIETEAYYLTDKASHASLGRTAKREGLFMPAGTIYMYYARGGDSLNISCRGAGNAVLIKSAFPYRDETMNADKMISQMQQLNPFRHSARLRQLHELCRGQTLLCKSLDLKVIHWDQQQFDRERLFIADVGYQPGQIIQTRRIGIPQGRDEFLPYRFIDFGYAKYCTRNPLSQRKYQSGLDYVVLPN